MKKLIKSDMKTVVGGRPPSSRWQCDDAGYIITICFYNDPTVPCGYNSCTRIGSCSYPTSFCIHV